MMVFDFVFKIAILFAGMESNIRSQPQVLVIEDSFVTAEYVKRVLERNGFSVIVASTATEGLKVAMETIPDLILLDVMLPDGDGFSLCELLKTKPALGQTPIIFVTSLEDVESRVRGLSIGAVDFITKPFAAEEIVARARVHVKIARQSRQISVIQSERLEALRNAQHLFLTDPDSLPDARCAVYYESAEEAGGDQYDIVQLGKGIFGFLVADIAGHGMETLFQASALKALFRDNASVIDSPSDTLYMINRSLKQHMFDGQHLTAFYLVLNRQSGVGTFACAGHYPALAVPREGGIQRLMAEGDVLGAFSDPRYLGGSFRIEAGSRYWLYTDGLLENFGSGQSWQAGLEKLEKTIEEYRTFPLREALEAVKASLVPPGPGNDDRILMAVDA